MLIGDVKDYLNATALQKQIVEYEPSPISTINGVDANDFLENYSKVTPVFNLIDPVADFNNLVFSAAQEIQGTPGFTITSPIIYPGADYIEIVHANGTSYKVEYVAKTSLDFSEIKSGQDFYDIIVTANPSSGGSDDGSTELTNRTEWGIPYPEPDVFQFNLGGQFSWVTGYILKEDSLGVLSIPSFLSVAESATNFSSTIVEFIQLAKQANVSKIVIDIQANGGGSPDLAYSTFKAFFPQSEPFGGRRMVVDTLINQIGTVITNDTEQYSEGDPISPNNPYNATQYLDVQGNRIKSWSELYGPEEHNGANFTILQRLDLNDVYNDGFSLAAIPFGYANMTYNYAQPFAAEDILLLLDGNCGSTCSIFAEFMKTEKGVMTVARGGAPHNGPMQGGAGVRGSQSYEFNNLNLTLFGAGKLDSSIDVPVPDAILPVSGGFNLADQIRNGDDTNTPLQFIYEASDCRIWTTPLMLIDQTEIWRTAANALWSNSSLCVEGSTGNPSSGNVTVTTAPSAASTTGSSPSSTSTVQVNSAAGLKLGYAAGLLGLVFMFVL